MDRWTCPNPYPSRLTYSALSERFLVILKPVPNPTVFHKNLLLLFQGLARQLKCIDSLLICKPKLVLSLICLAQYFQSKLLVTFIPIYIQLNNPFQTPDNLSSQLLITRYVSIHVSSFHHCGTAITEQSRVFVPRAMQNSCFVFVERVLRFDGNKFALILSQLGTFLLEALALAVLERPPVSICVIILILPKSLLQ